MTTPQKHRAMMKAFDAFSQRIQAKYEEAREALETGDDLKAYQILADIAKSHAKTSLSLRNVLVRDGKLNGDDR
jgi:hypothetical protein